jgi:glycosyltransferase involved in cell wall biosynthesis
LPLALVEAMLCGRFGIVSNVSGNKEVFEDNISGFLAEAPKAEYFDAAMERAWIRKSDWETIGQLAKNKIQSLVPENPEIELYKMIVS